MANELSELCRHDVKNIRSCGDCYSYWVEDPDNYFTKVCKIPHVIVFAKVKGFAYWPAKLMTIKNKTINVEFFGEHTQADIPAENCFLYSKKYPDKKQNDPDFDDAMEVGKFEMKVIKI